MNIKLVLLVAVVAVTAIVVFSFSDSGTGDTEADAARALATDAEAALARGDASEALRFVAKGLAEAPESFPLLALQARAYCVKGRFSDALQGCETASEHAEDEDQEEELRFVTAWAYAGRFLDAGERGDFNRADGDLRALAASPRFGGASKLLLGMALARKGENAEAKPLLEAGLADASTRTVLGSVERAEKALAELKKASG